MPLSVLKYSYIISGLLLIHTACSQRQVFDTLVDHMLTGNIALVDVAEFHHLQQSADVMVLDVRSREEYQISHLPGSILIDYEEGQHLAELDTVDRQKTILVYCTIGYRSEKLGESLLAAGFKDVHNLKGGIFSWKNEGMTVVNSDDFPTDSVHVYNKFWSIWLTNGIKIYE